jgi:hypothetical protein
MDFSLDDLRARKAGSGWDTPPDVDTLAALNGLRGSTNFAAVPEEGASASEMVPERKAQ